jgi:hypothetical protein
MKNPRDDRLPGIALTGIRVNVYYDSGVRADEGTLAMTFSRFLSEGIDFGQILLPGGTGSGREEI